MLGIAHTNKGTGDAVNRVLGSVGYVSDRIDSHKDAPLRRAARGVNGPSADTSAAVLGIAHTNKGTGDAVNRVLGSVGYVQRGQDAPRRRSSTR